jgi:hypothetical protein
MTIARRAALGAATAFLLALAGGAVAAAGATLPQPAGPLLLKAAGALSATNAGDAAVFDREMLRALDWRLVRSHTAWTEGEREFAGPTLESFLKAVGAEGRAFRAVALNDYGVEIAAGDAEAHGAILALDMDGRAMSVRDKGPVWLVYPQTAEQATSGIFNERMIWQLAEIVVR